MKSFTVTADNRRIFRFDFSIKDFSRDYWLTFMPSLVFEFYGKGVCVNGEFYFINSGGVVEVGKGDHVACLPSYWITMRFLGLVLSEVSQDRYPDSDQLMDIDDLTRKLAYKEIVDRCVFVVEDESEVEDYGEEVAEDLGCDPEIAIVPINYALPVVDRIVQRLSTKVPDPGEIIVSQSLGLAMVELGGLPSHDIRRILDTTPHRVAMYNAHNKNGFIEIMIAVKYQYKKQFYLVSNNTVFCGRWGDYDNGKSNMRKHFYISGSSYWEQRFVLASVAMFWARAVVRFRRYQSDQKLLTSKGIEPNPGPQVPVEVVLQTLLMIIIFFSATMIYVLHKVQVIR